MRGLLFAWCGSGRNNKEAPPRSGACAATECLAGGEVKSQWRLEVNYSDEQNQLIWVRGASQEEEEEEEKGGDVCGFAGLRAGAMRIIQRWVEMGR